MVFKLFRRFLVVLFLFAAYNPYAITFTVDTTADSVDGNRSDGFVSICR